MTKRGEKPIPKGEPIRLGLVGLGDWGEQVALAAALLSPEVQLVACYARSPERRAAFAARHRCRPCATYEEMLQDPQIDGIVIMTPNLAHRDQVIAAAAHGKDCLVTKPIATTIADGWAMIRACREAGVTLAVGHQSRREPAIRALKALLADGALGRPMLAEANISTARGLEIKPQDWRWYRDECPGGPLIQIGIHHIDTLQYLLGPIVRVLGWQGKSLVQADIVDNTVTLLEFANGVIGYLGSSYATSQACWIKLYGTQAVAHYDQHLGLELSQDTWQTGPVREKKAPGIDLRKAPIPTMIEEVAEFAECVRTGKPPDIDGEQGLRNLAVVLAAVRSAETGQAVAVDDLLHSA